MSISWITEKKRWRFEFCRIVGGQRHRTTRILPKGWSRHQAETFDQQETARLYAIATGVERERPLIDAAVKLYLDHQIPHQKDGKKAAQTLALLFDDYNGRYLDELSDICVEYIQNNPALARATVRNRLAYLRAACRYAFRYHKLGDHDPAERVVLPTPNNARNSFPSRADALKIMRKCGKHRDARAVLALAFYSGMRWRAELLVAKFDGDTLWVGDTKNDKAHAVPLHPKAHVYARRLPLKLKERAIYGHFKAAAIAAGLPSFTMHDQRHGTASTLINAGATLSEVGAFLNHSSPQATARYAHLVMATKRAMLKKLA